MCIARLKLYVAVAIGGALGAFIGWQLAEGAKALFAWLAEV